MAASKPRLIRNDLVTDADLARFQHASGSDGDHDPCPVADKAPSLDAMMSLIFRNERRRPAEAPGSKRSENLKQILIRRVRGSSPSVPRGAAHCLHLLRLPGGELHLSECARSYFH
jgi:hypothetical protein